MRKLLFVLLLLVVGVGALGVYLDWFRFSVRDKDSGKVGIDLTIDKDKIKQDAEKAKDKAKALGSRARTTEDSKPSEPAPLKEE